MYFSGKKTLLLKYVGREELIYCKKAIVLNGCIIVD